MPFPDAESNIIVGLCFGELPAAAVSLAKNLTELLPLAVEAVRVAFRAGIIINTTGKELEQQSEPAESWSIALSRESGIADGDTLKDICKEIVGDPILPKEAGKDAEIFDREFWNANGHISPLSAQKR